MDESTVPVQFRDRVFLMQTDVSNETGVAALFNEVAAEGSFAVVAHSAEILELNPIRNDDLDSFDGSINLISEAPISRCSERQGT